jgi:predicted phosphodiesterase
MGRLKLDKHNVLIIGDTHIPYQQEGYLEHCLSVQRDERCGSVVHIGDLVDNLSLSRQQRYNPDAQSPNDEIELTIKQLKPWFKAFPKVKFTYGTHDKRLSNRATEANVPSIGIKSFRETWQLPRGWVDNLEFVIDDVLYKHGTGTGINAHRELAIYNRMSAVQGHSHAFAGIAYVANQRECLFGMNVGTGIDNSKLAFAYGISFKVKPIVSCGVVYNGEDPRLFRMRL